MRLGDLNLARYKYGAVSGIGNAADCKSVAYGIPGSSPGRTTTEGSAGYCRLIGILFIPSNHGAIVYRLVHEIFILVSPVRLRVASPVSEQDAQAVPFEAFGREKASLVPEFARKPTGAC